MKTAGIIAEFNPFHNGHKYIIDTLKSDGYRVVCVIGDDFTQRGDAAIISKYSRALQALRCGADLCLLLPVSWSCSCAYNFALGGVSVLNSLGNIDTLAFGSECGDIDKLIRVSEAAHNENLNALLKAELANGVTFAKARQNALETLIGDDAKILENPNDTLATEYISAAKSLGANFSFRAVRRVGSAHDSEKPSGEFLSASAIRGALKENKAESIKEYLPKESFDILSEEISLGRTADVLRLETAILAHLRRLRPNELLAVPEVSEGLHNKIIAAAQDSKTLTECFEKAKSKRYTMARIRRIVMSSFLGITLDLFGKEVPYIKVLGFNKAGEEILKSAKPSVPLITRSRDYNILSGDALDCFRIQSTAADLYALSLEKRGLGGNEFRMGLVKTNE